MIRSLFRRKIFWFFVIGLACGLIAWRVIPGLAKNQKKETTYTVKRDTIRQTLTISGELDAEEKVTLRFAASGYISWVGVKLGDRVKKYQAIASLDQRELQKNLQKYLNTYMSERWDFEQTKDEYREPAQDYWNLSWDQRRELDRALEKAQFDLNSAVLDVELKDISLKYAVLISPIDGIVTKVAMPVAGVNVTPTQAEFEVTDPATLYFSLLPDQTEVTGLSPGMTSEIVFDSYTDEKVNGTIKDISFIPKAGETNTVYEVKIQFPLGDSLQTKYRLGMTGDATFVLSEKPEALVIPLSFINTEKDKKYVMKKNKDKKDKVYVTTGIESDQIIEITDGISEGDVIYD
jgi:RND family efflux transporter MFP subunit